MSFFTGRAAIASRMTSKRRAHSQRGTIARYARPLWLSSTLPLNARGGVTARFQSDAVSAAHDSFARLVKSVAAAPCWSHCAAAVVWPRNAAQPFEGQVLLSDRILSA